MQKMHLYCDCKSNKGKKLMMKEMCQERGFFDAIFEIVNNIYLENIELTPPIKRKLKKHLAVLDKIQKKPKSKVIQRKLVKQSGGFLPYLLPILTPLIVDLIKNAVSKKKCF